MIYLVVTQSMGRFDCKNCEANPVPSLFSKKTLKNDPKGPGEPSLVFIETGQIFPHLAIEKPLGIDVVSVPWFLHGMLSVVRMACGTFRCVMRRSQSSKKIFLFDTTYLHIQI